MKIKKNDTVLILTGDDKGKTGKVLVADPKANRVVVEGINVQKKHKKARQAQETSAIVSQSGPIDASNVAVICPTCGKAVKIGYRMDGDKKVRFCKKCKAVIGTQKDIKEAAKAEKTAEKKTTAKKSTAKAEGAEKKTATKKSTTKTAEKSTEKKTTAKKTTKKEA